MKRLITTMVVAGGVIFTGASAFFVSFPTFDKILESAGEVRPGLQFAQVSSPPGSSSSQKKPVAQAAPSGQPAQSGQAKAPAPAAGPGWAVNCKSEAKEKELECRMSQTVVLKQSGQVLANVTFRVPSDTKKPEIIVQLPLGVFLPAGATFQVDENAAQRLNFRACDRNGCFANAPVSAEVMATLKKGKQLKVGFQTLAEKPVTVPLSLDGFGESYDKMQKPS
jgi:invasion protein IalB